MKKERASQLQWENDIRVRCKLYCGYVLCFLWLRGMSCGCAVGGMSYSCKRTLTRKDSTINIKSYLPGTFNILGNAPTNYPDLLGILIYLCNCIIAAEYLLGFYFGLQHIIVQYKPWIPVMGICRAKSCLSGAVVFPHHQRSNRSSSQRSIYLLYLPAL